METLIITHNNLPEGINYLIQLVSELKEERSHHPLEDQWMDIDQVAKYIPGNPAKTTIYALVSKRAVPFHKKGKRLHFLRSEIDLWLKEDKTITNSEINKNALSFLRK